MNPMITVDREGLVLRPRDRVAMVREELAGRVEVLNEEGSLSWRPGPLDELAGWPMVVVAPGVLVNPAHATVQGEFLALPGGFRVRGALPAAPPAPPPRPEDPEVPFVGVRASEVLALEVKRRTSTWWTDRGPLEPPELRGRKWSGKNQAALHPQLVKASQDWYFNPPRLRHFRRGTGRRRFLEFLVGLDDGTFVKLGLQGGQDLALGLGLSDPDLPGPESQGQASLRRLGVRSWPVSLGVAPADLLRREFAGDPRRLLANLAAQTVQARRLGESIPDGRSHRGYYYVPVRGALIRAGLVATGPGAEVRLPLDEDAAWELTCDVLAQLVGEVQAFTYQDMGFRDLKPENRLLGARLPHLVLLTEKESLVETAREAHHRLGITVLVTAGVPTLMSAEFLAEDLRRLAKPEIQLLSYCDYDPVGWDIPVIFEAQLRRYGIAVGSLRRLVTPESFTPEEVQRLAVPLPSQGYEWGFRVRRWLRETGGVGGKALGLHADHLPPERVLAAVERAVEGGSISCSALPCTAGPASSPDNEGMGLTTVARPGWCPDGFGPARGPVRRGRTVPLPSASGPGPG